MPSGTEIYEQGKQNGPGGNLDRSGSFIVVQANAPLNILATSALFG